MATVEAVLEPYVNAPSLLAAEAELDRLVGHEDHLPVRLGDLYDDLAEHAAGDGAWDLAARLAGKAVAAGCSQQFVAQEMHGWYLLKAGATAEGEAVFAALCAERPDDAGLRITLGHARSDAGLQDAALDAFDEALAAAKRSGSAKDVEWARIERWAEREHAGLAPDADDELAPAPGPLTASRPTAWALAWFPPDQRTAALTRWPELGDDLADPQAYARRLEHDLRELDRALGHHPAVSPIEVERYLAWAGEHGHDPASPHARAAYAAGMLRAGQAVAWPPGRNDPCWCRSGRKYKRCCGAA